LFLFSSPCPFLLPFLDASPTFVFPLLKLELAAALGFLANALTTQPNKGPAGELLESAGILVAKTAAAANDVFQELSAKAKTTLAAEAESLVAEAAGAGGATAQIPTPGATTGAAATEEIVSAIGVRGGLAASESATRRLMRAPRSSNDSGSGAASSLGAPATRAQAAAEVAPRVAVTVNTRGVAIPQPRPRLTTAAELGNMPLKEAMRRARTGQVSVQAPCYYPRTISEDKKQWHNS
jgi:hypothetical protein